MSSHSRVEALPDAVVERQHVVLDRLLQEEGFQLLEFFRVLRCKVVRATEVFLYVVQLPPVLGEGSARLAFPWRSMDRLANQPSW